MSSETSVISGRKRSRRRFIAGIGAAFVLAGLSSAGVLAFRWLRSDVALTAEVTRGPLRIHLIESGVLKPQQSITYRSPLSGREAEIVTLVPEGTRVQKGDLLVKLDTTELERELQRAVQNLRQVQVDQTVAKLERDEAAANTLALTKGGMALTGEEERFRLELAEKRVERLRTELESLQPLLDKGYITREELDRVAFELEQAEAEASMARRKADVFVASTRPLEIQRAERQLAQREAQLQNAEAKLDAAKSQVTWLNEMIARCSIYARQSGLVVHEELLAANPRRKVRLGDRVTSSQGLVTIPEVGHMIVETSVREADLQKVKEGQSAVTRLDAFPDARLDGKVVRVGTMARDSGTQVFAEKRFDVIVELGPSELELRPEMTARVEILVQELPDALMAPVNAIFEREDYFVAHVVTPWGMRTKQVGVGLSNGTYVEVLTGLREGDRLSLRDVVSVGTPEESGPSVAPVAPRGRPFAPR